MYLGVEGGFGSEISFGSLPEKKYHNMPATMPPPISNMHNAVATGRIYRNRITHTPTCLT